MGSPAPNSGPCRRRIALTAQAARAVVAWIAESAWLGAGGSEVVIPSFAAVPAFTTHPQHGALAVCMRLVTPIRALLTLIDGIGQSRQRRAS
jgi:hypothetical protein